MTLAKAAQSGAPLSSLNTFRRRIQDQDLTAAAASQTFDLGDAIPDTGLELRYNGIHCLLFAGILLAEEFSGGGATAVTVDIGDSGDDNRFVDSADVFTGASVSLPDTNTPNAPVALPLLPGAIIIDPQNYQFQLTVDVTGANAADLTAGDMSVIVVTAELNIAAFPTP